VVLYILNIVVAVHFTYHHPVYLHIVITGLITVSSLLMLCVCLQAPAPAVARLENSRLGETLFTFRGRYMMDLLCAMFLFGLGSWGVLMCIATLVVIFGIRFVGVKQPDAFNDIFRQSDIESQSRSDSYTMEGTFDTALSK